MPAPAFTVIFAVFRSGHDNMKFLRKLRRAVGHGIGVAALALAAVQPAAAADYVADYGLKTDSPALDLGIQPLGYPSGVLSAVIRRDRILRQALDERQTPLAAHPFRRGADMLPVLEDRRLEAGLLGDMPAILAAAGGKAWIVGLVKQTTTAIVANGVSQLKELAGKRIGYVEVSSAHHTLLQGLAAAGLQESQVKLVALRIDELPGALQSGRIDAFAGWEPATSAALKNDSRNRIIFRGQSTDYLVIDRHFTERSGESAHQLAAALARAINWMKRSQANLDKAARWAIGESEAFAGKRESLSALQVAAITHRDILNIPSAPTLVLGGNPSPLKQEYEFLVKLGKLPADARWEHLEAAMKNDLLAEVIGAPRRYRLSDFDYED